MSTQDKHLFHTRSAGQINLPTHQLINSSTQKIKKAPTHQLKNSRHLQLTSFPTRQLKNLNRYILLYNIVSIFAPF